MSWEEDKQSWENWKQIVWVASYPKSGNTWFRALIDGYYNGQVNINDMKGVGADNLNLWARDIDEALTSSPLEMRFYARPYGLFRLVNKYKEKGYDQPLILKTHNCLGNVQGCDLLPIGLTKSIIHIIRDPRDILPSFSNHLGHSLEDTLLCMQDLNHTLDGSELDKLPDLISSWDFSARSFRGAPKAVNRLTIRYEDLKKDTKGWFIKALEHIGIPVDEQKVDIAIEAASLNNLRLQEELIGFKEQAKKAKTAFFGGEREKPSQQLLDEVVEAFKDEMQNYGYI